jgi:hypothetical protein
MSNKKIIIPKVLESIVITNDENVYKREGIELVEVYPGRWDININDKPTNKKIRHSNITYCANDSVVMYIGESTFGIDKLNNNFNELRKFLKSKRFNSTYLDKVIEYLMKAVDINKEYLENKTYSLK